MVKKSSRGFVLPLVLAVLGLVGCSALMQWHHAAMLSESAWSYARHAACEEDMWILVCLLMRTVGHELDMQAAVTRSMTEHVYHGDAGWQQVTLTCTPDASHGLNVRVDAEHRAYGQVTATLRVTRELIAKDRYALIGSCYHCSTSRGGGVSRSV